MPPQPLSSMHNDISLRVSPHAHNSRPDLAASAMKGIALWAEIESLQVMIMTNMLGTQSRLALDMYSALIGTAAQNAALNALARSTLHKTLYNVFELITSVAGSFGRDRHKLAHCTWAVSPDLPDALLLITQKARLDYEIHVLEWEQDMTGRGQSSTPFPEISRREIFIYRQREFDEINERLHRLAEMHQKFNRLVRNQNVQQPGVSFGLLRQLLSSPELRSKRTQLREKRKKQQALQQ